MSCALSGLRVNMPKLQYLACFALKMWLLFKLKQARSKEMYSQKYICSLFSVFCVRGMSLAKQNLVSNMKVGTFAIFNIMVGFYTCVQVPKIDANFYAMVNGSFTYYKH